jgi:hypothetical protein
VAFGFLVAFGVIGVAWVVAERIADPGGLAGWLVSAGLVAVVVVLSVVAMRAPESGRVLLVLAVVALVMFALLDAFVEVVPRDAGPVAAVAALALVVPLAFLGLRQWRTAGWLLVLTGVVLIGARLAPELAAAGESGGLRAMLGGSSGAVAVPMIIGGLLFLTARSTPGATRTT